MLKNSVGENAGKIWRLLNEKGELTVAQIKKELKIKNEDLYMAIGWLLREENLCCHEEDDKQYFGSKSN